MAHRTPRSSYQDLTKRLNQYSQGAPPSELLYQILALLFSVEEAELVAKLPIRPFNVREATRYWPTVRCWSISPVKKAQNMCFRLRWPVFSNSP